MLVLVTRPMPGARATARRLRRLGHGAVLSPVLRIEPKPPQRLFDQLPDATVITSANALRAIAGHADLDALRALPLHAVGHRTAQLARQMGFMQVTAAEGDLASLARQLAPLPAATRLLHLAGRDRAGDLAALLGTGGAHVTVREVYAAEPAARPAPHAMRALRAGKIDVALHFSPRSAALFTEQIRQVGFLEEAGRIRHLCLSPAIADVLRKAGLTAEAAARPDETALLASLGGSG